MFIYFCIVSSSYYYFMSRKNRISKKVSKEQQFKSYWDLRLCYPYLITIQEDGVKVQNREYKPLVHNTQQESEFYKIKDVRQFIIEIMDVLELEGDKCYYFYSDRDAPFINEKPDYFSKYQYKWSFVRNALRRQGLNIPRSFPYVFSRDYKTNEISFSDTLNSSMLINKWISTHISIFSTQASIKRSILQLRNIIPADDFEQLLMQNKDYMRLINYQR